MLEIIRDTKYPCFTYPNGGTYSGWSLSFSHMPLVRRTKIGVGGGFKRRIDAERAMKSVREEWPDFHWDTCTYDEWIGLLDKVTEKEFLRVLFRDLQW